MRRNGVTRQSKGGAVAVTVEEVTASMLRVA
jgi:hypothetical protein